MIDRSPSNYSSRAALGFARAVTQVQVSCELQTQTSLQEKNRALLLYHTPTETNIDISLGILPFEEEMVERGIVQSTSTLSVRLPSLKI